MFDENKHPRDDDGKFTDGQGKTYGAEYDKRIAEAKTEYKQAREDIPSKKGKSKSKDEFFGEEFIGYKGAEAIEKLLKEKRGHIKNAFERPEIGGIDLVWGDDKGGLLHTMQKRDKLLAKGKGNITGLDMARKIPEIIDKGVIDSDNHGRINIDYCGYRVGILPTIYNDKVNWIVTAMEKLY